MKILSSKSFGKYHSSGVSHTLIGLVFASDGGHGHLPTTICASSPRSRSLRLLTLFQLLLLSALVGTILVYTTLNGNGRTGAGQGAGAEYPRLAGDADAEDDSSGLDVVDLNAAAAAEAGSPQVRAKKPQTISANLQRSLLRHTHKRKQPSANRGAKSVDAHAHAHNRHFQSAIADKSETSQRRPAGELFYDYGGSMPNREQLDNVFLSVKSTKRFHSTRLEPILRTWFTLARNQTWFFTDDDDPDLAAKSNGHLVNTHCPSTHYRQALCCKMSSEFDTFLQTTKSWFCHFDDDNYVNVPALLNMLGRYNPREYWYLGKPSLKSPIRIKNPDNHSEDVSFWFATGGAGFCLSRALALRMSPLASGGKFMKTCEKIQLPDDVTMGYIAGHLLGQNLTVIPQFHSHFETMKFVDTKNPAAEITFSYVHYAGYRNTLDINGLPEQDDPSRFLSLHCRLFPRSFTYCSEGSLSPRELGPQHTSITPTPTSGDLSRLAYYSK